MEKSEDMKEFDKLASKLSTCDEIVVVHSEAHGGLLQFYKNKYFSGEHYLGCGKVLNDFLKAADPRGIINYSRVNLLKESFRHINDMAQA